MPVGLTETHGLLTPCRWPSWKKHTVTATFLQAEPHRQMALLQDACTSLARAQEQEDAHFAGAQPEQRHCKAAGPMQPKVRNAAAIVQASRADSSGWGQACRPLLLPVQQTICD